MKDSATPGGMSPQACEFVLFGEVLLDCFPDGRRVLGGAPFNVAWGLRGLGRDPLIVSAVGDDADGQAIREKMASWGLSQDGLQTVSCHATGTVDVTLQAGQPAYEICHPRAWDAVEDEGISATGMLYHGLLALRDPVSRATFEALAARSTGQRFFDINLRPPHVDMHLLARWVEGADWLKLNNDELSVLVGVDEIAFLESAPHLEKLRQRYGVRNVLLTGAQHGAMMWGAYGEAVCAPAPDPDVMVDTVGAGDAMSAATLHGILSGWTAGEIITKASHFSANVCGMRGATSDDRSFYNLE